MKGKGVLLSQKDSLKGAFCDAPFICYCSLIRKNSPIYRCAGLFQLKS